MTSNTSNLSKILTKPIEDIVGLVKEKHPEFRVIISGLLPRRDELNKNITSINNGIEKVLENKQNTSFIHHENISTEKDFYDNKHLNERGVKFFAKNIKGAYFNTKPKKMPYIRKNPNPYPTYKGNITQHTYPHTFNLKYPIAPNYHHQHGQIHVAIFQDLRLLPLKWLNLPPNMHVGNQVALVCYLKANSKTMSTS
jgi:hypothetical protein